PSAAQPGQLHAFVNREEELGRLYTGMISAGNALAAGQEGGISRHFAVVGPKGVGKSALVLQALGMVRDEVVAGQRLPLPPDLIQPVDRHRWLVLCLSGKHVSAMEGIADAIRRDILSILDDVREGIRSQAERVLDLPFYHHLFPTREGALFDHV